MAKSRFRIIALRPITPKYIGKSKEDYLKAVLIVLKEHGACRNADVSSRLGVSKSSTCIAIKKLEQDGFVERDEWRILLTEKGKILAENLLQVVKEKLQQRSLHQ